MGRVPSRVIYEASWQGSAYNVLLHAKSGSIIPNTQQITSNSWWFFNQIETLKLDHLPNFQGEHKTKYLKPPTNYLGFGDSKTPLDI